MMTDLVRRMTAEEYFALPETNQIEELIDGELIVADPTRAHQKTLLKASSWLTQVAPQGETMISPSAIRFEEQHVFEPDIFWIRPDGDCKPYPYDVRSWIGAPDLVIEILSPSTAKRDRGVKFDVYERHGVREYWLIDLDAQFVEMYAHVDGAFKRQGIYGVDEAFTSPVLGVEVKVEAIFAL
jgi:Uma2 family endonuclease